MYLFLKSMVYNKNQAIGKIKILVKVIYKVVFVFLILLFLLPDFAYSSNDYVMAVFNSDFKITSLMQAVKNNDVKAVEIFLRNNSRINEKNVAGVGVLHIAVKHGAYDVMEILLKEKANINDRDNERWTPLMRACLNADTKAVQILLKNGAGLWLKNVFDESALFLATTSDCNKCLEYIINEDLQRKNAVKLDYKIKEIDKSLNVAFIKQNKDVESILNRYRKNLDNGIKRKLVIDTKKHEMEIKKIKQLMLVLDAKKMKLSDIEGKIK